MEALTHTDAEKTVLGCCLLSPESLYRVLPLLAAQDFSTDAHRQIFHVISGLAEDGKPVDVMTVSDALITRGRLDAVGGVGFLASLSDNVTSELARVTNVEYYTRLIIDKGRRRQARAAGQCLVNATDDIAVSTDDCIARVQESLLEIEAASGKTSARHIKEFMPEVLREIEAQAQNRGLVGLPTGIDSLDLATGGIRAGELWVIGALPGRGKTALGVQIVLANGEAGTPTYVFSLEMQDLEIGKRFLAAKSAVSATQIRNPRTIKPDRWRDLATAAAELVAWPVYVDSRPSLKIEQLLASARLFIRRHGVKLIIVDYLRLIEAPGRDLRERVGNIVDALRQLAKNERIGVVLLSQLRRPEGGINSRPSMVDLKESGDIEAHSHVVLLPYLPVGEDGTPLPEEQLLIIGKNRNGAIGSLPTYFDERRLQFRERDTSQQRVM